MLRLRNGAEKILVDGGVVANNPSACALAEAISINLFGSLIEANDSKKIYLVSLGTGNLTRPIKKNAAQSWGSIQWMRPILDVVFDGSSASVDFICRQILPDDQFFRLQVELLGANEDLDDVTEENMRNLVSIAETYATSTHRHHAHGAKEFKRIVDMLKSSKPIKN